MRAIGIKSTLPQKYFYLVNSVRRNSLLGS